MENKFSDQLIDRVASSKMGVPPANEANKAALAAAQGGAPAPNPTPGEKPVEKKSPEGEAVAAASGEGVDDKMSAEAIMYEIDMGDGNMRKLSPSQISGTMNRYRDLNYKHQQMSPVMRVIEQAIKGGHAKDPKDAAEKLAAMMKAGESNPTLGDDGKAVQRPGEQANGGTADGGSANAVDALKQWEEENAISLPPGFREMAKSGERMASMEGLLKQIIAQGQQVGGEAAKSQVEARAEREAAMKARTGNVLNAVSSHVGLKPDQAEDFNIFAMERGYTVDDFHDPELTLRVMTDFKNSMGTEEFEHLKRVAAKRQAYTGSIPQAGGAASADGPATPAGGETFNRMADAALQGVR